MKLIYGVGQSNAALAGSSELPGDKERRSISLVMDFRDR